MSHSASMNLPFLMVPGSKIKFAMVEGYPSCGTSANGIWSQNWYQPQTAIVRKQNSVLKRC